MPEPDADAAAREAPARRVDQRRIPGISRLYADYLYEFGRVGHFYPGGAPSLPQLRAGAAPAAAAYPAGLRAAMIACLRRQNAAWGAGPAALAQVELLARPDAVVVVAGQQAGLFGGPLLSAAKALTALRWAAALRADGVPAVALFWIASQDHDLVEVNQAWRAGEAAVDGSQVKLEARAGQPAGDVHLNADVAELLQVWQQTDATDGLEWDWLRNAYRAGETLSDAFARLYTRWFGPQGLVLFDPMAAPELAPFAAPLYRNAILHAPAWETAITARNAELVAAGYHVQVTAAAGVVPLFLHRDGLRLALRRDGAGFISGGEPLTLEQVVEAVAGYPDRVSPAALLRPLVQDVLFPVVAQVAGPAEAAYLAQSAALRPLAGQRAPVILPRVSLTLLSPKSRRLLSRLQLDVADCFTADLAQVLARRSLPGSWTAGMEHLRGQVDLGLEALKHGLRDLDPTLLDATVHAEQKIRHQLDQLSERVARALARRHDDLTRQAAYLAANLYPRRELQERVLNGFSLMGSAERTERIHSAIALDTADHQVFEP